jgi:hypothetical protein
MNRIKTLLAAYIHETLGIKLELQTWLSAKMLPLYLGELYSFSHGVILDRPFIFAFAAKEEDESPAIIRKQLEKVRELACQDVVYVRESLSSWNRKRLIEQKVSFIVPGNQLYLPLLGMDLREYIRLPAKARAGSFSPSTQLIVLSLLNRHDGESFSATELSGLLGMSPMTISRAFNELAKAGIFRIEKEGKARRLYRDTPSSEIWNRAEPLLQSPVRKRVLIARKQLPKKALLAGLSALSEMSMLAAPAIAEYAIASALWNELVQAGKILTLPGADEHSTALELWKYDPLPLAKGGVPDRLSLFLALRGDNDERVQLALREMMEAIEW